MPRTILAFADCRLDVAARSLVRAGESVELPPIVFDCAPPKIAMPSRFWIFPEAAAFNPITFPCKRLLFVLAPLIAIP